MRTRHRTRMVRRRRARPNLSMASLKSDDLIHRTRKERSDIETKHRPRMHTPLYVYTTLVRHYATLMRLCSISFRPFMLYYFNYSSLHLHCYAMNTQPESWCRMSRGRLEKAQGRMGSFIDARKVGTQYSCNVNMSYSFIERAVCHCSDVEQPPRSRDLQSSTFQLNVSAFCWIRCVHDFPPIY